MEQRQASLARAGAQGARHVRSARHRPIRIHLGGACLAAHARQQPADGAEEREHRCRLARRCAACRGRARDNLAGRARDERERIELTPGAVSTCRITARSPSISLDLHRSPSISLDHGSLSLARGGVACGGAMAAARIACLGSVKTVQGHSLECQTVGQSLRVGGVCRARRARGRSRPVGIARPPGEERRDGSTARPRRSGRGGLELTSSRRKTSMAAAA